MREYKGLIFTNHALSRIRERGLTQSDVWAVWHSPDSSKYAKSRGGWVYRKKINKEIVEVVAKKNDNNQWVVLSAWHKGPKDGYRTGVFMSLIKKIFGFK